MDVTKKMVKRSMTRIEKLDYLGRANCNPAKLNQIKRLALQKGKKVHEIVNEAFDRYFEDEDNANLMKGWYSTDFNN